MAAKKPPDEIQQERFFLDLQSPERQVVPAVQLQQRQIKMTYLSAAEQQSVPSIGTSESPDKNGKSKQIVGEELLLGEESFSGTSQEFHSNGHTVQQRSTTRQESVTSGHTVRQQTTTRHESISSGHTIITRQESTTSGCNVQHQKQQSTSVQQQSTVSGHTVQQQSTTRHQSGHVVQEHANTTNEDSSSVSGRTFQQSTTTTRESASSSSLLSVEYKAQSSQMHDVAHANVLEFFEEQDKTFKEHASSFNQRKTRSPSPSPVRQSVGLDHLDNLVKLMEQLSSLRDENVKLKKKCAYLESTKSLLEVKSALEHELIAQSESSSRSLPSPSSSKSAPCMDRMSRPRLPSAEDVTDIDRSDSQSDTSPKRHKPSVHKRSYSTGSLKDSPQSEILLEQSGEDEEVIESTILSKSFDKVSKSAPKSPKSPSSKRKSKISNWAKFKKVITRPKLPEEISFSLRSIKDFGRGSVSSSKELTVPSSALENRSVDSGVGSGIETDELHRKSTSSGDPPSPSPFTSQQVEAQEDLISAEVDLGTEIWMGDPEWLEKHGDELMSDSVTKEIIVLNSAQKCETDQYLQVPLPRRKSSPSLLDHDDDTMDPEEAKEYQNLRRSSSYKVRSSHGDISDINIQSTPKLEKKAFKQTWGKRVKHIVHNRKDSIKKRLIKKGSKSDFDPSGGYEVMDADAFEEMKRMYSDQEGPLGRSTPKTSPMSIPRHKGSEDSPPYSKARFLPKQSSLVDVEAILGSMSDEFSKKMEQWEEKKSRTQSSIKDTSEGSEVMFPDSIGTVSPEFQKKMDEWERSKSVKGTASKQQEDKEDSREGSPVGTAAAETQPPVQLEELQRKLTESFNRKLEEWERIKYRKECTSPTFDRKDSSSKSLYARKEERHGSTSSSRKVKGEKDKGKQERRRERELQRVEREQHKLHKERIRIEKERLKALEREARIEKMKGRLSQPEMDSKYKNPILSPLADYKVTTDFARKLYEWETKKGVSSLSMATYLEAHQRQMEQMQLADEAKKDSLGDESALTEGRTNLEKGQRPPPLTLHPCFDSPEETSPGDKSSEASFEEDTSYTMEGIMDTNITSLEKANNQLMEKLHEKELEYENLQDEVKDLSGRLERVKDQHSKEAEKFKQECIAGWPVGKQPLPPPVVTAEFVELEDKIGELQHFGENLAMSMEGAAQEVCKWQSMEGQESVNSRLVELLEQMKVMLMQAAKSQEASQTSSALKSFDKLYRQAMQLQVQLSNLRLSQLERNKEIVSMKRQLLLQEANNLLLQTDITRREAELHRYKAHSLKRSGPGIKRWNTYGGMESRVIEGEEIEHIPPYKRFTKSRKDPGRHPVESPHVVMETVEPSASFDTSKEETYMRADESTGLLVDVKQLSNNSSASFTSTDDHNLHSRIVDSMEYIDGNGTEIDHTEQQIERMETEDSIKVSREEQQVKLINNEKAVEISMIKLPTANISLPRDISQQELCVPRRSRTPESDADNKDVISISSSKSETKFPELLIPEWRKSSEKGPLTKMPSFDLDQDDQPADKLDCLRIDSTDSERRLLSDGTSRSNSETHSVSKSMEDTEGSSFEHDTVFMENTPHLQTEKVVHSAPTSQSGVLERIQQKIEIQSARHSPSSQLSPVMPKRATHPPAHWPRIRPVSSAHRIKPADELLEESRRYRKGHSVYMMRILRKYAISDDAGKYVDSQTKEDNKENIKEGYVKAIVKRLSRESTPEYNNRISEISSTTLGSLTVHRSDSPRAKSEFVQQIVRKLSSPSGPEQGRSGVSPLSDLTNGGSKKVRQLAEAFDSSSSRTTPDRVLSDSEFRPFKSVLVTSKKVTHEIRDSYYDSSSTLTNSQSLCTEGAKPDSTISTAALNFSSMPLLSVQEGQEDVQNGYRERAATTATCDTNGSGQSEKQELRVTLSSPEDLGESSTSYVEKRHITKKTHNPKSKKLEVELPIKAGQKPGKSKKMGTIGVLCQQSMMSFDLGLSLQVSEQQLEEVKLRKASEGDYRQSRPLSSGSEGEPSTSTDEKPRSRTKFFETKWLHRKFFKVSK